MRASPEIALADTKSFADLIQGDHFEFGGLTYLVTDMEGVAVRPLSGVSHRFGPDAVVRPIPCSHALAEKFR